MDRSSGHYFNFYTGQEATSVDHAIMQDPMIFNTLNLNTNNLGQTELRNSFLALLSGSTQSLHSEPQRLPLQLPNSKYPSAVTSGLPGSCFIAQHHESDGTSNGAKLSAAMNPNCSQSAVLHNNLQTASSFHGIDSIQPIIHHTVHTDKTGSEGSHLKHGHVSDLCPTNVGQHFTSNFHIMPQLAPEAKSIHGGPRVFCSSTSGDLLLSDMGLLRVVCLCHGLLMSVAKFCEHSGSGAVNPGEAVRLQSGESIAQWRRLYFLKFGIRILDDTSGWDWLDGISSPGALVTSSSKALPNISKNSNMFQSVDSFGGLWTSRQPRNDLSPYKPYTGQVSSVSELIHAPDYKKCMVGPSDLKSFLGTSDCNNLRLRCPEVLNPSPDKEGQYNGHQTVADNISFMNKGSNPFISNPNLRNSMSFGANSDINRGNNSSREGFVMNKDSVASNIELRLGQPYQPTQPLGVPMQLQVEAFSVLCDSQKAHLPIIQTALNPRITAESFQNAWFAPPETSSSIRRQKEIELNHMCLPVISADAISLSKVEQLKVADPLKISPNSIFLPYFTTLEGRTPSQSHASECMGNSSLPFMPRIPPDSESHIAKRDQADLWSHRTGGMEDKLSKSGPLPRNHIAKGQLSSSLADDFSYIASRPSSSLHYKQIRESGHLAGSIGRQEVQYLFQGTSDDHNDISLRSTNYSSPVTGQSGLPSVLPDKNGANVRQHLLNENMRLLALEHLAELSKQENSTASRKLYQEGHPFCDPRMEMQKGISVEDLASSGKLKRGPFLPSISGASEGVIRQLQSCCNCCLNEGFEKWVGVLGHNGCCCFSVSAQKLPLGSKAIEHAADEQALLRRWGAEKNGIKSVEVERHNQTEENVHVHGNCSCSIRSRSLVGKCVFSQTQMEASEEEIKTVNSKTSIVDKRTDFGQGQTILNEILSTKNDLKSSQWKDVPSKAIKAVERHADILNTNQSSEDLISEILTKGSNGISLEQQISNVCSGNSAPAVTEGSVEVDRETYPLDVADCRSVGNPLVDEGSGTERCKSSDESGRQAINLQAVSSSVISKQSPLDLIDELRLRNSSFRFKGLKQQLDLEPKVEKKKPMMKWKRLTPPAQVKHGSFNNIHYSDVPHKVDHGIQTQRLLSSRGSSMAKRKRFALSSSKIDPQKRPLHGCKNYRSDKRDDDITELRADSGFVGRPKVSSEKRVKLGHTAYGKRVNMEVNQNGFGVFDKKIRLEVCGNSGIISSGKSGNCGKQPKIVSLKAILKVAKKCALAEHETSPKLVATIEKTPCFGMKEEFYAKFSYMKKEKDEVFKTTVEIELESRKSSESTTEKASDSECSEGSFGELSILKGEGVNGGQQTFEHCKPHRNQSGQVKPVLKETRKRSLYELTGKDAEKQLHSTKRSSQKGSKDPSLNSLINYKRTCLKDAKVIQGSTAEPYQVNSKGSSIEKTKCSTHLFDSNALCCVCGSSSDDEVNRLLECCSCLIRVHQACYGVSKVPKGYWCCRPCKINSKKTVCVLCGYEGGAMTRALRSRHIIKSLLKSSKACPSSKIASNESSIRGTTSVDGVSQHDQSDSSSAIRPIDFEVDHGIVSKTNLLNSNIYSGNSQVRNIITAEVLVPTVARWVHMVCGLWTPGTRCPNVDTMSAFDVSGASYSRSMVCSMCKRPGGVCIQCRVVNCSVQFHPWCAHRKGLLQSEVEGLDNEKVGFYGRCLIHATNSNFGSDIQPVVDAKIENPRGKESTCARTEGYKGRKVGKLLKGSHGMGPKDNNGCLVTQEQINAWLHINGQKSFNTRRGLIRPLIVDIELDCRKEYTRYKQSKGWMHLVVYKSGIHALGLYTSHFIPRGAMVVEYVGEIVGLRVADKRETEYQSGRKLQHKSACYFFRIDKEHIIDATRKGGIARFVNHSCLPNCVAKIISLRNEKKVVFFAERDINPGEEITYDYHFNHEEGDKIPCFCNSKNCRQYLN